MFSKRQNWGKKAVKVRRLQIESLEFRRLLTVSIQCTFNDNTDNLQASSTATQPIVVNIAVRIPDTYTNMAISIGAMINVPNGSGTEPQDIITDRIPRQRIILAVPLQPELVSKKADETDILYTEKAVIPTTLTSYTNVLAGMEDADAGVVHPAHLAVEAFLYANGTSPYPQFGSEASGYATENEYNETLHMHAPTISITWAVNFTTGVVATFTSTSLSAATDVYSATLKSVDTDPHVDVGGVDFGWNNNWNPLLANSATVHCSWDSTTNTGTISAATDALTAMVAGQVEIVINAQTILSLQDGHGSIRGVQNWWHHFTNVDDPPSISMSDVDYGGATNSYSTCTIEDGATISDGTLAADSVLVTSGTIETNLMTDSLEVDGTCTLNDIEIGGEDGGFAEIDSLTIDAGSTLTIYGTVLVGDMTVLGTLVNNGSVDAYSSITFASGSTYTDVSGALLDNEGTLTNGTSLTINGSLVNELTGSLVNNGSITSNSYLENQGTCTNNDNIYNYGTIENDGTVTNNGLIYNEYGSAYYNEGSTTNNNACFYTYQYFQNDGDFNNTNVGDFLNAYTVVNNGTFENGYWFVNEYHFQNYGTITDNEVTIYGSDARNYNTIELFSGSSMTIGNVVTVESSDALVIDAGATLIVGSGSTFTDSKLVTNNGDIQNAGTIDITSSTGDFEQGGTLENTGAIAIDVGAVMNINSGGSVTNNSGGTIAVSGSLYVENGGTLTNAYGTTTIESGGYAEVDGVFANWNQLNIDSSGTMQIGNGTVAGSLTSDGNVADNGILQYLDGYSSSARPSYSNDITGSGHVYNLGVDIISLPDASGVTAGSGITI